MSQHKRDPDEFWNYKEAEGKHYRLSVFLPRDKAPIKKRPIMVIFHGGAWVNGDANWHYPDCTYWSSRGMIAVSVDYRLRDRDNVSVPLACIQDAKSVIRFLKSQANTYGIDTDNIICLGASAGGHLAASTATIDDPESDDNCYDSGISAMPKALILCNPWYRCEDRLSPAKQIKKNCPPLLTFIGDCDPEIPVDEMKAVHENYKEHDNFSKVYVGIGGKHGFCIGGDGKNPYYYWFLKCVDQFLCDLKVISGKNTVVLPKGIKDLMPGTDYTIID
jgi:dienelactone hydrolase